MRFARQEITANSAEKDGGLSFRPDKMLFLAKVARCVPSVEASQSAQWEHRIRETGRRSGCSQQGRRQNRAFPDMCNHDKLDLV